MNCLREILWWGRVTAVAVRRWPGWACLSVGIAWWAAPHSLIILGLVVGLAVVMRTWATLRPTSFTRVASPLRVRAKRWMIRRQWADLCTRCGLGQDGVPPVLGTRVSWPHVSFLVRPLVGQTSAVFEGAAEALRVGVGAAQVRVTHHGTRDLLLIFTVADELRTPFDAQPGLLAVDSDSVVLGRREDGGPWRLALGPHTLVAGSSGSGKGSVFWSFAFGLAPAVREGRVQLHGVDLKGGMEILMGSPLFTMCATNAVDAVAALETLVSWMRKRTLSYAGRLRAHVPTVDEPLHVVMIDELAALTAYCPDRDLQRRAETAINLLCSQGRAPGFMVFACLQDPRKEVIPSRGLFTQMVGLRLKDLSETSMVLGETALLSGAHCHRITRAVPGTGYVLPEEGGHPVRVRAGFASDDAIRDVATQYATPTTVPVPALAEQGGSPVRRPRRASAGGED